MLELAGGTRWWTERLAIPADRLTVVDSAPETLVLNRDRVGRPDVDYVEADIFSWKPERTYDVVFFSFWLSHVSRQRVVSFWKLVERCLAPAGRVFIIDNRDPNAAANSTTPTSHGPSPISTLAASTTEASIASWRHAAFQRPDAVELVLFDSATR